MPWVRWGSALPALRGPTLVPRAALGAGRGLCVCSPCCSFCLQQFGKILDVEIIFNERGSKVGAARGWHRYRELQGGGRGSRDAWGLLCLRSPPLLPRRTRAQGGPMSGHPCPAALCWPGGMRVPVRQAPEGGEGRGGEGLLCPCLPRQLVSLCVSLSLLYLPCFLCPSPRLFSQLTGTLGPQPGPPEPAGAPAWALCLCTAAASSPAPALLIHPLSLSVPAPSLCLSLSLSFSFSPLLTGFWVCNF